MHAVRVDIPIQDLSRKDIGYREHWEHWELRWILDREVAALEVISHPNVVTYYGHTDSKRAICIYMEFCHEGSLMDVIEGLKRHRKYMEEEDVWRIFAQLPRAALHRCQFSRDTPSTERGEECRLPETKPAKCVLHPDVKPENIFLTRSGPIKLGDFGLSKVTDLSDADAFFWPVLGKYRFRTYDFSLDTAGDDALAWMVTMWNNPAMRRLLSSYCREAERPETRIAHCDDIFRGHDDIHYGQFPEDWTFVAPQRG